MTRMSTTRSPRDWITDQVKTGLSELPSNAKWLFSKAEDRVPDSGGKAGEIAGRATEGVKSLKDSVIDATPLGGDSVESLLGRAHAQSERARQAEQEAIDLAREANEKAQHAKQVGDLGRARVEEQEKRGDQMVEDRVTKAKREAEDAIQEARREAREEADQEVENAREEAHSEALEAQREAEKAKAEAEEALADATKQLAEARSVAAEAERAAREKAEEARSEAERLAGDAEQRAKEADERIAEARRMSEQSAVEAKETTARVREVATNGDLKDRTKDELLDLAAAMDIEGRSSMTKAELVSAISRSHRRAIKAAA
jgi:colicin import membrane protein